MPPTIFLGELADKGQCGDGFNFLSINFTCIFSRVFFSRIQESEAANARHLFGNIQFCGGLVNKLC